MSDGPSQEMTLDEWMSQLPPSHRARRELAELQAEVAHQKTTMLAARQEIDEHWRAHCDTDGYGPVNLMRRLEVKAACYPGHCETHRLLTDALVRTSRPLPVASATLDAQLQRSLAADLEAVARRVAHGYKCPRGNYEWQGDEPDDYEGPACNCGQEDLAARLRAHAKRIGGNTK